MKKQFSLIELILFFLALSLVSCEKETDEELIIGKWNVDHIRSTEYLNGVEMSDGKTDYDRGELTFEFNTNGTGKYRNIGINKFDYSFEWELEGNVLIYTKTGEEPIEMPFTLRKNKLILSVTYELTTGEGEMIKIVNKWTCSRY
jgi:hypothetical protein